MIRFIMRKLYMYMLLNKDDVSMSPYDIYCKWGPLSAYYGCKDPGGGVLALRMRGKMRFLYHDHSAFTCKEHETTAIGGVS